MIERFSSEAAGQDTRPISASDNNVYALSWRKTLAILFVGLGITLVLLWHRPSSRELPQSPITVEGPTVRMEAGSPVLGYIKLEQARLQRVLEPEPVPGRVAVAESRAEPVVAPLQGRVDVVAVRLGQRVNPGDRLVSVRSPALVDLLHEIEVLQASEAVRAKTVERLAALVQLRAAAEKDLLAAQLKLEEVRLSRRAAELKLRSRPMQVSSDGAYWLLAPRGGVVVERDVLVGEEVGPDRAQPLLVIADLSEVVVTADVPEHRATWLHAGGRAKIRSGALPGRIWTGEIEYVSEVVDPQRRMVNVRIRVANPDHLLRPNAFVQVVFDPGDGEVVVVPAAAVVTDDQQAYVFVMTSQEPPTLKRRDVTTGRQNEHAVEILSGLEPGESYVAEGANLLANAMNLVR
ncbi:Cobalt-zinc-cadmium resistance protein CzcB [bacterium HR30]|nr:Cobalt-zinc-cadmium resistance protein CzcB [bacterium HR30]